MDRRAATLALAVLAAAAVAGCIGDTGDSVETSSRGDPGDEARENASDGDPRIPDSNRTGPEPPEGEDWRGLEPIDLIFGGSLRHAETRVLLVPPGHGDLGTPTNDSRSAMGYLEATLAGIHAWEPAIERFVAEYPRFSHLQNVTVEVDVYNGTDPSEAGYDFVIGYTETSGPAFRGVAFQPPGNDEQQIQRVLDEAGLGETVHFGNRYVVLSLFASAPRAGQQVPDYPETHEIRGVTMHEFAHTWGLGHSEAWTRPFGPDLMNSPYPFVYGDGDPAGDGGERSPELCITSLDLFGLAEVYRWLPDEQWEPSEGSIRLPEDMTYRPYCGVFEEARMEAQRTLAEEGIDGPEDLQAIQERLSKGS
jgi:hypothetical protein